MHLEKAIGIKELGQRNLWVIYGRSGSGKTEVLSTFPKPLLYLQIGDDGSNSISGKEGIKAISVNSVSTLKEILNELLLDKQYASVAIDTFSLLVNEWIDVNAVKKNKKVSQQMWGEIKTETEEIIRLAHAVAKNKNVIITCHEATDSFEGMEDEIAPDIRPSVSKGARTYLEAMANYGIHTTIITKDKTQEDGTTQPVVLYAAHVSSNPYYWTKTQKPASIKMPKIMVNPTHAKIIKLIKEENTNGKKN